MTKITSYKDLQVWQRSMSLVETIYRITAKFPHTEQWGLISQMRRAAISVPSNIRFLNSCLLPAACCRVSIGLRLKQLGPRYTLSNHKSW
jgi:23S rRNA-intervening sequence protein